MKDVVLGQYKGIEFPAQLKGREKEDYLMKILVESSKAKVSESSVNDRGVCASFNPAGPVYRTVL